MRMRNMPAVEDRPDSVGLVGGLDITTPAGLAAPGTLRLALNYEPAVGGGYERIAGFERYDGRPSPSAAQYQILSAPGHSATIGMEITGATSGATGTVIAETDDWVAITKVTGIFVDGENLMNGALVVGAVEPGVVSIDGFVDNDLFYAAAEVYRAEIGQPPGSGPVRGVAVVNDTLYCWRDNVDESAMVIHKATTSGWQPVQLHHELSFTAGSSEYLEGDTISQGGTSATVLRVALEGGAWSGTAVGRLIITEPTGGVFSGGAAAGDGACTLSGPSTQIELLPGGRVRTDAHNMTASLDTRRIYGCDGVNREFEFGDDILVPLNTGMVDVFANAVKVHRNHVFFGYRGSLQHSAIGNQYSYNPVLGAAEIGTGDVITDLVPIGGSEDSAALMVLCQDSVHVLYGTASSGDQPWRLLTLSRVQGAQARTAQDLGGVIAMDAPGAVSLPATDTFGNFAWNVISQAIDPIAREQAVECSVVVRPKVKYRAFFGNGTGICGMPRGQGRWEWTTFDLGRAIYCAIHTELGGRSRTFYGTQDGWVLEADVGRSLDGESMLYGVRTNELNQRSPAYVKQYRRAQIELEAGSAMVLTVGADFFDGDEQIDAETIVEVRQYGQGLQYDVTNFDQAYWDTAGVSRQRIPVNGQGTAVAFTLSGQSDREAPHTLRMITTYSTRRRLAR